MTRTAGRAVTQEELSLQQELDKLTNKALENVGSDDYQLIVRMVQELAGQVAMSTQQTSNDSARCKAAMQFQCLLRSIANNASKIQEDRHEALLRAIFKLSLWSLPDSVQDLLADLLVHLTWVRIGLQDACIQFLICNFCPPRAPRPVPVDAAPVSKEPYRPSPEELRAHACVLRTLDMLIMQQPLCTKLVKHALEQHFPHRMQPQEQLCPYVRGMLQLAEMPAGKFLWDSSFDTLIRRLVEIDADIRWEGIVEQLRGQEDEDGSDSDDVDPEDLRAAAALFSGAENMAGDSDCEIDGCMADASASARTAALLGTAEDTKLGFEGHAGKQKHAQAQPTDDDVGPSSSLQMAHRLDPLMGLLFDHMHVRAREDPARLWRDCMHAFDIVMLGSQRIKFTPHVILFAAHITGTGNAKKFASDLVGRICDPAESNGRRITCAAYLGSFLARFAPLPLSDVTACLENLLKFANDYSTHISSQGGMQRSASMLGRSHTHPATIGFARSASTSVFEAQWSNQEQHDVFYASCQAAMYSVCFHGNRLSACDVSAKDSKEQLAAFRSLVHNVLIPLMSSPLKPLEACLPTVTEEFTQTLVRHGLKDLSQLTQPPSAATGPRRKVRCDTYFPFDPYLLPRSASSLKLQKFYRKWKRCLPCNHANARDAVDHDIEDDSHSDDGSTLDGASDEGENGMVGSFGAGQPNDASMLASSYDRPGAQNLFVNPFAGAPQKIPPAIRCCGADDTMGRSPHSDGCESPAYGSLGPTQGSGAHGMMYLQDSLARKQDSSASQCANAVQSNPCIAG